MPNEWRSLRLGDVCSKIGSGATPRGGSKVYSSSGKYALIRSQNIHNEGFRREGLVYVDESEAKALSNVEVLADDVLLNITGDSVARVCQTDSGILPARVNQHVAIIRSDPRKLNPQYLRYFLVSSEAQARLLSWAGGGGTRNALTKEMIASFEIEAPYDLREQCAIAHILGTLDEKIESNRRMNETLEGMARALFKAWFVDFEPVRAKMEGRWRREESLLGLPADLYDLFPERLVDSELGAIPEGWKRGTLGDVLLQVVDRCKPSEETRALPYVPIDCISARSLFLSESKHGEEAQSSLIKFRKGDLLFGAMRPYFHKVAIAPFDGTTRTTVFVLHPHEPTDLGYSVLLLHDPKTIEYATNHSKGSTIPYAVWEGSLETMPIVLPPKDVRRSFDQIVQLFLNRIPSVFFANRTLAELRDTLLSKLISGELRVLDIERIVGDSLNET